ncbi:MAG: CoA transferase [Alphaproteobacteria bacterium]|nr:CoA transferase [Alphaproteobacteria bacterium]
MQPLKGIRVLDFSTLLPGPMATLILAEAGAEVIKIERPGRGDEMRSYRPSFGPDSVNFALLNRGKKSVAIDLKETGAAARLGPLIASAQVLVEQFRPGVMDRLGLGYGALSARNPALVYCSLTGFGQSGPKSGVAAHDINYIGDAGLLSLSAGPDGTPVIPPGLIADIGGGALPAVINILLALREAERTGRGRHLDIAMCDGVLAWTYWATGLIETTGTEPRPGGELVTGGSPRYQVYPCADGRFLAAGPLEQKFWDRFCELIGLAPEWRDDRVDAAGTAAAVRRIIAARPAAHWEQVFAGEDVCCTIVRTVKEAMADPHLRARGVWRGALVDGAERVSAVPVPLAPGYGPGEEAIGYPHIGADNHLLDAAD